MALRTMNHHRVLAIGAAGKWFNDTYEPLIASASDQWTLVGVADVDTALKTRNPATGVAHISLKGTIDKDISEVKQCFIDLAPDLVIISSDPVSHFAYADAAMAVGADVICDKPPIAIAHQLRRAGRAGEEIRHQYANLVRRQSASVHRRHRPRKCHFLLPLRRRQHFPYGQILNWVGEIKDRYGVDVSCMDVAFNDGSFRFAGEYDRPGAHGYRQGLGVMTHTGYHFVDFVAACCAPSTKYDVLRVECTRLESHTTDGNDEIVEAAFRQLLAHSLPSLCPDAESAPTAGSSIVAETDARMSLSVLHAGGQRTRIYLSILHRGCTRRKAFHYPMDTTHDVGRVDDVMLILQQGPFQSIQMSITDNAGGVTPHGYGHLVRRVHPLVAVDLGIGEIVHQVPLLIPGDAANAYREIVEAFLGACTESCDISKDHPLHTFTLERQALSAEFYASYFD